MSAAPVAWLPEAESEFRTIFQEAPFGLALSYREGNRTIINPALKEMLAARLAPSPDLSLAELIHASDHAECERIIAELWAGKRSHCEFSSADGSSAMRWQAWGVSRTNHAADYLLALAEEVPSAVRLHQAGHLEAMGRLAGGVAHDFNNLLTGILLYCDLLLSTIDGAHRGRKYAEEIRKAGMQASSLVKQLLAISRPSKFQPRPLSLNEVAEGMRNLLVRLTGESIELRYQLDPALGLIRIDPTHAQQILLNLVLNARDAMPHGGRITVETRNCKVEALSESPLGATSHASLPCALFVVEDTGQGMDAHTRAHIFEPFFTTKGGKGTGLGMVTVYDIVTTNCGLIHVGSEPGHGTRVSVVLPLAGEAPALTTKAFYPVAKEKFVSSEEEE